MKNLAGKNVLVTGGARGIGYACAEAFASEGSTVLLADVLLELAEASAATIRETYNVKSQAYGVDVGNLQSITELMQQIKAEFGHLDVLVNNAGIQIRHPSLEFSEADWDSLMAVNLKGVFFCSQKAAEIMKAGSAIVNISSATSVLTTPGRAPYCISKAGVNAMTSVLGAEWAGSGIRVNAVAPGWIMTDMVKESVRLGAVNEQQVRAAVPVKKFASTAQIAAAVVYLASDEASYVTGQTLFVDGGWSALGMPDLTEFADR